MIIYLSNIKISFSENLIVVNNHIILHANYLFHTMNIVFTINKIIYNFIKSKNYIYQ